MTKTFVQVARVLHATKAEGPGLRSAVWFQGCSIRCSGCINPHLFTTKGGTAVDVDEVIQGALEAGSEGLTFLGGEPFDQAGAAASLAAAAHRLGLGVITFSGYRYEDLRIRDDDSRRLLADTDLLVDGPYLAGSAETNRSLVGSTNQRFLHLTDRYADFDPVEQPNHVDVRVGPDGAIELAGFLGSDGLKDFASIAGAVRRRRA